MPWFYSHWLLETVEKLSSQSNADDSGLDGASPLGLTTFLVLLFCNIPFKNRMPVNQFRDGRIHFGLSHSSVFLIEDPTRGATPWLAVPVTKGTA